jgi:hypothetical protein
MRKQAGSRRHQTDAFDGLMQIHRLKRRKVASFLPVTGLLAVLLSCKSIYLGIAESAKFLGDSGKSNALLYYSKSFMVHENDSFIIQNHQLWRIGENSKSFQENVLVHDGPQERLIRFNARVLSGNKVQKEYDKNDLLRFNLSSSEILTENNVFFLPLREDVNAGNLMEIVTTQRCVMPFFGIQFSLDGIDSKNALIKCSIQIPDGFHLKYKVLNDSLKPRVENVRGIKVFTFAWAGYEPPVIRNPLDKKNASPAVIAQVTEFFKDRDDSSQGAVTWREYGDEYLDQIQNKKPFKSAIDLARSITRECRNQKEMMDAIAEYCMRNIRYGQVYGAFGETIPNDFETIMARKYGDCKDYSMAMVTLANSLGIPAHLALCRKGRGTEFDPTVPVSQFNHMLVHFADGAEDHWYDGTNRTGKPDMLDDDLINQTVLILDRKRSVLSRIGESPNNLLRIEAHLSREDDVLSGSLVITLHAQYANPFLFREYYLNDEDMRRATCGWLLDNISRSISLQKVEWRSMESSFIITLDCKFPNSLIPIKPFFYLSPSRVFDRLLPLESKNIQKDKLFYLPYYGRVQILIGIDNLSYADNSGRDNPLMSKIEYSISPGPFSEEEKTSVAQAIKSVLARLEEPLKLMPSEEP